MHLADAFIQNNLHCIQVTVFYILSALAFPGNRTHDLGVASAMLYPLSYRKALSLQSTLSILGLTETWIRPEDSATPAALSHNFSFSHTPRQVGRGGGTGLLISNNWKYSTHSPLGNHNSFESHAITVTAPIKLQIVVIYRPPGQILATFLEELDGLLSSFMEDGTPLLVFGDFNIYLDRPYATDFHSLIA